MDYIRKIQDPGNNSASFWTAIGTFISLIVVISGAIWWAASISSEKEINLACINKIETRLNHLETDMVEFNKLQVQVNILAQWIERNRVLPERLVRMETQLDNLTAQLSKFNDNFNDLRLLILKLDKNK